MGRGDKKSRKGKIFRGSFGNTRPKKVGAEVYVAKPKKEKVAKKETIKKTTTKNKTAAKKTPTNKKVTKKS